MKKVLFLLYLSGCFRMFTVAQPPTQAHPNKMKILLFGNKVIALQS